MKKCGIPVIPENDRERGIARNNASATTIPRYGESRASEQVNVRVVDSQELEAGTQTVIAATRNVLCKHLDARRAYNTRGQLLPGKQPACTASRKKIFNEGTDDETYAFLRCSEVPAIGHTKASNGVAIIEIASLNRS